jgi:hypothetical protein
MSVVLNPPELGFKRPFNREVCQVLELYNENPEAIVFKVKTTAPKQYVPCLFHIATMYVFRTTN